MLHFILSIAIGSSGAYLGCAECLQPMGTCYVEADAVSEVSLLQLSALRKVSLVDPTMSNIRSAGTGAVLSTRNVTELMSQNLDSIKILHIGKTGGSSLHKSLHPILNISKAQFADEVGHARSYRLLHECTAHHGIQFAYFVRAPVQRFVSSWISRFRMGGAQIFNPWSINEFMAFVKFHSPDELGCALSSSNSDRRSAANNAMHAIEHVKWSLADYWGGLENFAECMDSNFFVGRFEHLDHDYSRLVEAVGAIGALRDPAFAKNAEIVHDHKTPERYAGFKHLGSCAIENLRQWYKNDYELIGKLTEKGVLPGGYPLEIDTLDMKFDPGSTISVGNVLSFKTTWLLASFSCFACLCINLLFLGLTKTFGMNRRSPLYNKCFFSCGVSSIVMVVLLLLCLLLVALTN